MSLSSHNHHAYAGTPRSTSQEPGTTSGQKPYKLPTRQLANPGAEALEVARKMLGTPYRYGGNDPNGFTAVAWYNTHSTAQG